MYSVQIANTSSGVVASKGLQRSTVPFLRSSMTKNGSGKSVFGARTVSGRMSNSVRAAVEAPAPTTTAASSVSQAEKLLDIVFVATEVGPWSKTGKCLNGLSGSVIVLLTDCSKRRGVCMPEVWAGITLFT